MGNELFTTGAVEVSSNLMDLTAPVFIDVVFDGFCLIAVSNQSYELLELTRCSCKLTHSVPPLNSDVKISAIRPARPRSPKTLRSLDRANFQLAVSPSSNSNVSSTPDRHELTASRIFRSSLSLFTAVRMKPPDLEAGSCLKTIPFARSQPSC